MAAKKDQGGGKDESGKHQQGETQQHEKAAGDQQENGRKTACSSSSTQLQKATDDEADRDDGSEQEQGQGGYNEAEQPAEKTQGSPDIIERLMLRDALPSVDTIQFKKTINDQIRAQAVDEETRGEGSGSEQEKAEGGGNEATRHLHPPESLVCCSHRAHFFLRARPLVDGTCLHTFPHLLPDCRRCIIFCRLLHAHQLDQCAQPGLLTIHQDAEAINAGRHGCTEEDGNEHDYCAQDNLPPCNAAGSNAHEHGGRRPERNVGNHLDPDRVGIRDPKEAHEVAHHEQPGGQLYRVLDLVLPFDQCSHSGEERGIQQEAQDKVDEQQQEQRDGNTGNVQVQPASAVAKERGL